VVCSWLGNSPRIAQQSYLLVTEDDFAKAAGLAKKEGRGDAYHPPIGRSHGEVHSAPPTQLKK
ncbi:MAG: hypothetical protein ACOVQU_13810, partial [Exiguobacterium acetylicum]